MSPTTACAIGFVREKAPRKMQLKNNKLNDPNNTPNAAVNANTKAPMVPTRINFFLPNASESALKKGVTTMFTTLGIEIHSPYHILRTACEVSAANKLL